MLIVEVLVSAVVSQVVKGFIAGRYTSEDAGSEAAGAVSQLLAVLSTQQQTTSTLARMEQKLENIALGPYRRALESGYRALGSIETRGLDPMEKHGRLNEARRHFDDAVAAGLDAAVPAELIIDAELLEASCYLLMGSPRDFDRVAGDAAERAFAALNSTHVDENAAYRNYEDRLGTWRRAYRLFTDEDDERLKVEVRNELTQQKFEKRDALAVLFNEIQESRRNARTSSAAAIRGYWEPGHEALLPVGAQGAGGGWRRRPVFGLPAQIAGITLRVTETRTACVSSDPQVGCYVVDAVIEFTSRDEGRMSATAEWPTRGNLTPSAEQEERAALLIPPLAEQHGLPGWYGRTAAASSLQGRVALRCLSVAPSRRLVFEFLSGSDVRPIARNPLMLLFEQPLSAPFDAHPERTGEPAIGAAIRRCPACGKKNRVPPAARRARCGNCRAFLPS